MKRDELDDARVVLLADRIERLGDRRADLVDVELDDGAVALDYLIHIRLLLD